MKNHEIKSFFPDDKEVTRFRESIFNEDFNLSSDYLDIVNFTNQNDFNKILFWFSNEKFLQNNFDRILIYYVDNKPISIVGGTFFNKNLYRTTQMYYILKKYRKINGMNTFHYRHNGFFDFQKERAKKLGCTGMFISVDPFDKRHITMYHAMKNDIVGPGHMPNHLRKYTAKDFFFIDKKFFEINYTKQWVIYHNLKDNTNNFESLFQS